MRTQKNQSILAALGRSKIRVLKLRSGIGNAFSVSSALMITQALDI